MVNLETVKKRRTNIITRIQRESKYKTSERLVHVPFRGVIMAGRLHEAIEDRGTIAIPQSRLPFPSKDYYTLQVSGDSMFGKHINNGDIVLIKEQKTAKNGEVVVALVDNNEATLKTFYKEKNYIRLQPENKSYEPIIVGKDTPFAIQGVYTGVVPDVRPPSPGDLNNYSVSVAKEEEVGNLTPSFFGTDSIKIYQGDALDILDREIDCKVDMVYLDPPFATGRDFKYQATSKEIEFTDKWNGDAYEKWLDSLITKLKNVLKKDGNLFFHISAELSATPQRVLQKHFKRVEPIFWKKAHGKNTVKNKLGSVVDIIFRASQEKPYFKLVYEPLNEFYFENSYRNRDTIGLYALGSLVHDKTRSGHKYKIEHKGIIYESLYGWKKSEEEMRKLIRENKIHFGKATNGKPPRLYKKLYKHECKGKPLSNLWTDIAYITRNEQDKRLYPTQKPVELLKRLIEIGCKSDGIVLDPVAGSGTTGAAAIELKRSAILIDKNKEAVKIMQERLKV